MAIANIHESPFVGSDAGMGAETDVLFKGKLTRTLPLFRSGPSALERRAPADGSVSE